MKKFLFYTLFLIFASYFLINTLRILYHLYGVERKMGESKKELATIEEKNKALKNKLADVTSPYYIEKEARDTFLMKKPNEEALVIKTPESVSDTPPTTTSTTPNWKKWFNLLLSKS